MTFFNWNNLFKSAINDFLHDSHLKSLTTQLFYRNANNLYERWRQTNLSAFKTMLILMKSNVSKKISHTHQLHYWNTVNVIQNLLDHKSFKKNLVYVSVHQYSVNNERVYTEMHTCDWWWNTQKQLLNGVIIVSVLIAFNKTQLLMHEEDQNLWSVYLIIENLSDFIRCSQKFNSLWKIAYLSIVKTEERKIKLEIFHQSMSHVLKCEYSLVLTAFDLVSCLHSDVTIWARLCSTQDEQCSHFDSLC